MDPNSVGLIVQAPHPDTLRRARELLLSASPDNRVTAELPIIDGFAVQLDQDSLELIPRLGTLGEVHVLPDLEVTLPPERAEGPGPLLDTAAGTLHLQQIWDQGYRGQGVAIAIIDTGLGTHPDIRDRILAFQDFVNGRKQAYDDNGHGTQVAGIASGDGSQSRGRFKGVAPEAGLVGVKVLDENGNGSSSKIVEGIQWAVENRARYNIRAVNISIGAKAWTSDRWDPMARAATKAMESGIFVAVAAGNSGPGAKTVESPGIAEAVCTVANLDERGTSEHSDDRISTSSSRGPAPWSGAAKPDVSAPGTWITSCGVDRGYVTMSGTSAAAPMVAGAAALLIQAQPGLTGPEIKRVLMDTAARLEGEPDTAQGRGLIDPPAALAAVKRRFA